MSDYLRTVYRNIAMNLLHVRRVSRLDQAEFARKCGLSRFQYLRIEGARENMTLKAVLKVCETFNLDLADLLKDPFNETLRMERREKVSQQNPSLEVTEDRYVSRINKNISVKKLVFGQKQIRRLRLQNRSQFEILVLKGELSLVLNGENTTLRAGQHLALDFNPQRSFAERPTERIKLASLSGAEVLLIHAMVH